MICTRLTYTTFQKLLPQRKAVASFSNLAGRLQPPAALSSKPAHNGRWDRVSRTRLDRRGILRVRTAANLDWSAQSNYVDD
jgi:hypothetical protein